MTISHARWRQVARRGVRITAAAGLAAATVAVAVAVTSRPRAPETTPAPLPTATAAITRGTAAQRLLVPGSLGYQGSYTVVHQGQAGILTSVAPPGSTVERGGVLYAVSNQPVRLLIGETPAYRELAAGIADGPDVRQLEQNLVDLGADPNHRITVDDHFSSATTAAIRQWQAAWGLPPAERTGRLPLGQIVFRPATLRVAEAPVAIGTSVSTDAEVLSTTSTTQVVIAQVSADRRAMVTVGDGVSVQVPGLPPVQGSVTAIGQPAPQSSTANGGAGESGTVTVPVTVSVQLPAGAPALDQTPVQVAIVTDAHQDALLVPITALLAKPGGGYQVRMATGEYREVRPGLFDDSAGLVEITGEGLTPGQLVEVPAQ